jgi:hypothetical protein
MIKVMPELDGIVEIRAGGKLTRADYKDVLLPRLAALTLGGKKLRVLMLMDETFTGWDLDAAWDNTVMDFRHRKDFEKIAVVGAPRWEDWCVKLAGLLMKGELRAFPREQLPQARGWLKA